MGEEATIIKDERVDSSVDIVLPDFSGFDQEPLGWSLSMSNNIDREDNMSISFTNIPNYKGAVLSKKDVIQIPAGDAGTIDMIVKEVSFNMQTNRATTTVLLATRKIFFDQEKFFSRSQEEAKAADVLGAIADHIGVSFNEKIVDDVPWGVKKVVIGGNQNILEYINKSVNKKKGLMYNWWIDAFNRLHLHERKGINATPIELDFNKIGNRFIAFTARIFDSKKHMDGVKSENQNDPGAEEAEVIPVLETTISGNTASGASIKNIKHPSRTGSTGSMQLEKSALKKVTVDSQTFTMSIAGIEWVKAHSKVKLKNFPFEDINDQDFVVSSVNISQRTVGSMPTTDIVLNRITKDMLEQSKTVVDPDPTDKTKTKVISTKISGDQAQAPKILEVLQ